MGYKKGERIYHVDGNGNVHPSVATDDEKSGAVALKYPNGKSAEIGTFHLFATEVAANRAALARSARGVKPNPVRIVRDPK
jgi:hypothetical protein